MSNEHTFDDIKASAHKVTLFWILRNGNWFLVWHRRRWFAPLVWRLWDGSWRLNLGPVTVCANRPLGVSP